jgi:hypothetical protein
MMDHLLKGQLGKQLLMVARKNSLKYPLDPSTRLMFQLSLEEEIKKEGHLKWYGALYLKISKSYKIFLIE